MDALGLGSLWETISGSCRGFSLIPCCQVRSPLSEFSIIVDRSSGVQLGVDIDFRDGTSLVVESVTGGALMRWNRENPKLAIQKGDRIVEVNSSGRGDVHQLVEGCKKTCLLTLTVVREGCSPVESLVEHIPLEAEMKPLEQIPTLQAHTSAQPASKPGNGQFDHGHVNSSFAYFTSSPFSDSSLADMSVAHRGPSAGLSPSSKEVREVFVEDIFCSPFVEGEDMPYGPPDSHHSNPGAQLRRHSPAARRPSKDIVGSQGGIVDHVMNISQHLQGFFEDHLELPLPPPVDPDPRNSGYTDLYGHDRPVPGSGALRKAGSRDGSPPRRVSFSDAPGEEVGSGRAVASQAERRQEGPDLGRRAFLPHSFAPAGSI